MMRYSLFPRLRTYYSHDPDYAKPLFEIPERIRDRRMSRLNFLYWGPLAAAFMPELERILKVHCAHKTKEMTQKEQRFNPAERFSERDMILITYGDIVQCDGTTPLKSLHQFVEACNQGAINAIHILPFFPYSSDRGFAIIDYKQVDPRLGTWGAYTAAGSASGLKIRLPIQWIAGSSLHRIESDIGAFRQQQILIHDCTTHPAIAADLNICDNDRIIACAVTVDSHAGRQDTACCPSTGNNACV
jgi:hypothetical protein